MSRGNALTDRQDNLIPVVQRSYDLCAGLYEHVGRFPRAQCIPASASAEGPLSGKTPWMAAHRRQTKNAKVTKVSIPSMLAILATLTIFLDESRGLGVSRRPKVPTTKKSGRPPAGAKAGGVGRSGTAVVVAVLVAVEQRNPSMRNEVSRNGWVA